MDKTYQLTYENIGPVFRMFCFRLRLIEVYKQPCPMLFMSRGGIRLRYFYEQYLKANSLSVSSPYKDFYVSRIAVMRALLFRRSPYAIEQIAHEYRWHTIFQAMQFFLPDELFPEWRDSQRISLDEPFTAKYLSEQLESTEPHARLLQGHVEEQYDKLRTHLGALMEDATEAVLVDTGWSGSIIRSLQEVFPKVTFTAAFFGRHNYGNEPPEWFNSITGLILQRNTFNWFFPETCFIYHRHLIESLCEPLWPSVESYRATANGVEPASGFIPEHIIRPGEGESSARAVENFIFENADVSVTTVLREYDQALRRLARIICFPSVETALALGMASRSVDFGIEHYVPVLLDKTGGLSRIERVRRSLWRPGQVAVEFPLLHHPVQLLITLRDHLKRTRPQWIRTLSRAFKRATSR